MTLSSKTESVSELGLNSGPWTYDATFSLVGVLPFHFQRCFLLSLLLDIFQTTKYLYFSNLPQKASYRFSQRYMDNIGLELLRVKEVPR